jgi:hypothetical protein
MPTVEFWTLLSLVIAEASSAELSVECTVTRWLRRGALCIYKDSLLGEL